jgi:hypothetical protein
MRQQLVMRAEKICSKSFLKEAIVLLSLGLVIGFAYRKLPFTFFQQDEWLSLGVCYTARLEGSLFAWFPLIGRGSLWGHFNPLVRIFNLVQFILFGLNFKLYAYASILLHIINCFTFYVLSKLLFKEKKKAFLACLLVALNSIPHQATTWIGTYSATQPVLFLALISMIFFVKYLKSLSSKSLFLSLIFLLLGLGFRESILFLFLLYPMWAYFTKGIKTGKKILFVSLIFLFLFFIPRLFFLFLPQSSLITEGSDLPIIFLIKIVYRLLTTPFKALAQVFVIPEWIISVSEKLVTTAYPYIDAQKGTTLYGQITQTIASDIVSYTFALIIAGFTLVTCFYLRKNKKTKQAWLLLGSFIFIFLSALPFAFIPGKAGTFSFLDSRYLHFASLGAAVFLVLIIYALVDLVAPKLLKQAIIFSLIFIFCLFHYIRIQQILARGVEKGQERIRILEKISEIYPKLGQKSVFYTESTKSFYGLPPEEKILPFQSGFGQTLLVWYAFKGNNLPTCFFKNNFLWDISSQEYKECDGRGFGYFRDYDKMLEVAAKYELKPEDIYAFFYDAKSRNLSDITLKTREGIKNDLAKNKK